MQKMIVFQLLCLFFCSGSFGQELSPDKKEKPWSLNLFLYVKDENENECFTRLVPFYSHKVSRERIQDELLFWPLLAGYEISKNPLPSSFPHGSNFQWNIFPLLTLGGSRVDTAGPGEVSTMVSFLFMTYFQERIREEYINRSWYSLPVFSFYNSDSLVQKNAQISNIVIQTPFFSITDARILYKEQFLPMYQWEISPLPLIFEEEAFRIVYLARWGRDSVFRMFSLDTFSLFSVSTTFSAYPGADYHRFCRFEMDTEKGLNSLFSPKLAFPTTRMGILSPFLLFETSPDGLFSCQLLPFFYYRSQGESYFLNLILLGLEFGSQGVRFNPRPKFFPLVYHDESHGKWDILWPLFTYVDDPAMPARRVSLRFLMDYRDFTNVQGESFREFSLVEGLIFSARSRKESSQYEILPSGLLFGYYASDTEYQWRFLGCGYQETTEKKSLQIFFIKIPIQYKRVEK